MPFPSPGDLPNPGIEPTSLMSPVLAAGGFFTTGTTSTGDITLFFPHLNNHYNIDFKKGGCPNPRHFLVEDTLCNVRLIFIKRRHLHQWCLAFNYPPIPVGFEKKNRVDIQINLSIMVEISISLIPGGIISGSKCTSLLSIHISNLLSRKGKHFNSPIIIWGASMLPHGHHHTGFF